MFICHGMHDRNVCSEIGVDKIEKLVLRYSAALLGKSQVKRCDMDLLSRPCRSED